ncbi:MAG: BON domain-containing protein [Gemmatimonadota bacterium]
MFGDEYDHYDADRAEGDYRYDEGGGGYRDDGSRWRGGAGRGESRQFRGRGYEQDGQRYDGARYGSPDRSGEQYTGWDRERSQQWDRQDGDWRSGYRGQQEEQWHGSTTGRQQRYGSSRGEHTGRGPKGYQRSDDRTREDVCEALSQDGQIDASEIEVTVKGGEVTLSGTVPDRETKRWAEDCVESCSGVRDVQNRLKVSDRDTSDHDERSASRSGSGNRGRSASGRGNGTSHQSDRDQASASGQQQH